MFSRAMCWVTEDGSEIHSLGSYHRNPRRFVPEAASESFIFIAWFLEINVGQMVEKNSMHGAWVEHSGGGGDE